MLTPEYIDSIGSELLGLYDALEDSIVEDIARRIVKTGYLTDSAEWEVIQAQQSGMLLDDVIWQIASISDYSEEEVRQIFEDAGAESIRIDSTYVEAATGKKIALSESGAMRRLLDENIKLINREVGNLTGTTAVMSQMSYLNATNMAYMQVTSGAFSYQTAIARAIKSAAAEGAKISYPSGRSANIDVAIRRAVLTGVNQVAGKLTETYAAEMDCGYYETTAHAGARPDHQTWQGRVFKIKGSSSKYPNFYDATGYGTGRGLCGWNCRHSFHPFWPGISKRAYDKKTIKRYAEKTVNYNGVSMTEYEASQLQRRQEREIRESKRTLSGLNAAIKESDDDLLTEALKEQYEAESVVLKAKEKKLKDFCHQTNSRYDSARTQVHATKDDKGRIVHFDKSAAQRAVQSNKKALANKASGAYNSSKTEYAVFESKNYTHALKVEEAKIYKDKLETATVIDKSGKVIFTKSTGSASSVVFTEQETSLMKGAMLTHNHPSGSTFSLPDVALMLKSELKGIRATGEKRTYQLAVARGKKVNTDFLDAYSKARVENKAITDAKFEKLNDMLDRGKITKSDYTDALVELNRELDGLNNMWLKENAQQYNLRYSVIERS